VKSERVLFAGQTASGESGSTPSATAAPHCKLFAQYCVKCHGTDGKGSPAARNLYAELPDFSDVKWQKRHTDARLLSSILDGKGDGMPGFKGRISREQAQELTRHLRKLSRSKKDKKEGGPRHFEEELHILQAQFEALQRKVEELWWEYAEASKPPG
jgi:mono/diheme cytochrome c family protein